MNDRIKIVLGRNISVLMKSGTGPKSQLGLKKASGIAQATIGRILRGEVCAQIDTVQEIAHCYNMDAWQLLVPMMNPDKPPKLVHETLTHRQQAERVVKDSGEIMKLARRIIATEK